MKENGLVEFRWQGRGGQGAKTACLLLADAAFSSGKFVQGFPEYGPERMGAPITAYNRISDTRCSIHCNIDCPDYVVVVDETLLNSVNVTKDTVDVTKGLSPTGAVIVNTAKSPGEIRGKLRHWTGPVCTIDARRISEETLGRNFPNTPMLSAAVRVSGVLEEERFKQDMEESFHHKFAAKPQVVAGNMAALMQAWEEVQVG